MSYDIYKSGELIAKNLGDTSGRTANAGGSSGGLKMAYEIRHCTATDAEYTAGHYYFWYKLYGWFSTNVNSSIYICYYSTGSGGYIRLTGANGGTLWNATLQDYTYRANRSPRWSPNKPPSVWYAVGEAPGGYQIKPEGSIDLGVSWAGDTFTFSYYRARFMYNNNYSASYNNTQSASVTIEAPPAPPEPDEGAKIYVRTGDEWKECTPYVRIGGAWKECKPAVFTSGAWKQ